VQRVLGLVTDTSPAMPIRSTRQPVLGQPGEIAVAMPIYPSDTLHPSDALYPGGGLAGGGTVTPRVTVPVGDTLTGRIRVEAPTGPSVLDAWWTAMQSAWARTPRLPRLLVAALLLDVLLNLMGSGLLAEEIREALGEALGRP